MMKHLLLVGVTSGLILAGCGAEVTPDAPRATPPLAEDNVAGRISFAVDGAEHHFDYLPHGRTFYYSISSAVSARPSADSSEELTINFLYIDLKKTEYPATLPAPRTSAGLRDPMSAGAAVGFIYINAEGTEWAGPGHIDIASFDSNGVLIGTFTNVSLPHTEKKRPNIVLSGGYVEAQIGQTQ